jgi:hypothetical protein
VDRQGNPSTLLRGGLEGRSNRAATAVRQQHMALLIVPD